MTPALGPFSIDRAILAVEKVRERLFRTTAALDAAQIRYAVAGGNAVALWVSRVDESAVRNTQDVDILVRRPDFGAAKAALESVGFIHRDAAGSTSSSTAPAPGLATASTSSSRPKWSAPMSPCRTPM